MLNVAIVGCGQVARAHVAALAAVPSARVVAVCDRDLDRARELAPRTPSAAVERDLEEALAHHRIEVVHVLTPPADHAGVAIQAAEAGCDVLVEKPMALDVAEADRIIDAARAAGVRVVPNHSYLFKPSIERARTIVASGAIGDVVAVNTFYGISGERSAYGASAGRSHWAWSLPGGVFTNFLPHLAYLQLEFLGGPPRVVGAAFGGDANDPTELVVQVAHQGALGTMTVSMRAKPYMKYVEVFGTRGIVHADLVREVAYVHRDRPLPSMIAKLAYNGELVTQVAAATLATSARVATGRMPRMPELHIAISKLYESLESGTDTPTTAEQGREIARVLEDVRSRLPTPLRSKPASRVSTEPRTDAEQRARGRLDGEVLVTGATGFLGHHLVEALVRCGARPVVLVRDPSRIAPEVVDHVRVVRGDLRDGEAVADAIEGVDLVFHAAAVTTNKAPATLHEEINVAGTRLLMKEAAQAGVRRVVHASSVIVYGVRPGRDVVSEATAMDRSERRWDHYLRTKVQGEDAAREETAAANGVELVILRLGILYGHERPLQPGIVTVGPLRLLMGDGRNHLPYLHVDDAVDAMLLAGTVERAAGRTYNVIGEAELRVRDVTRLVATPESGGRRPVGIPRPLLVAGSRLLERRAAKTDADVPPRLSHFVVNSATRDVAYSTESARRELGWTPSISLLDGVVR